MDRVASVWIILVNPAANCLPTRQSKFCRQCTAKEQVLEAGKIQRDQLGEMNEANQDQDAKDSGFLTAATSSSTDCGESRAQGV